MRAVAATALLLAACSSPDPFRLEGVATQGGHLHGRAPPRTAALMLDGQPVPVAPDRRFLIGFGRDAPVTATLSATLRSGATVGRPLVIAPRLWPVDSLPARASAAAPDPFATALRGAELTRIRIARALALPGEGWRGRFRWPVEGRISAPFGAARVWGGIAADPHSGVDIARPEGWPVVAPADGVVTLAGPPGFSLEGQLVILDHGLGLSSAFLHLDRVDVTLGERVAAGQRVGAVGATGRATGPHLHWGMMWNGVRLDPALFVEGISVAALDKDFASSARTRFGPGPT